MWGKFKRRRTTDGHRGTRIRIWIYYVFAIRVYPRSSVVRILIREVIDNSFPFETPPLEIEDQANGMASDLQVIEHLSEIVIGDPSITFVSTTTNPTTIKSGMYSPTLTVL